MLRNLFAADPFLLTLLYLCFYCSYVVVVRYELNQNLYNKFKNSNYIGFVGVCIIVSLIKISITTYRCNIILDVITTFAELYPI